MDFNTLLATSVKQNASDLHLCAGYSPRLRIDGQLCPLDVAPLEAGQLQRWLYEWLSVAQRRTWERVRQVDFALEQAGVRLRGHAFTQRYGLSLALRPIPGQIPSWEALGVPPALPTHPAGGAGRADFSLRCDGQRQIYHPGRTDPGH